MSRNLQKIKEKNKRYYERHRAELLRKRSDRHYRDMGYTREERAAILTFNKSPEKGRQVRAWKKGLVIEHYGGVCSCCGETEQMFLSLDHINGGGTKHRKELGKYGTAFYAWIIKNDFPEEFQVLCYNCNLAKGFYGICPHAGKPS